MINEKRINELTYFGLQIYCYILSYYYPDRSVLHLAGKQCRPAPNPYNQDKPTLNIIRVDNMFSYFDSELSGFTGSPLDFAALHFNLHGQELLEMINKVLFLDLDKEEEEQPVEKSQKEDNGPDADLHKFSFYKAPIKNVFPYANITIKDLYKVITGTRYKESTEILRSIEKPLEARNFKSERLEYVTFSGTFKKRADASLIKHSGLMVIDIDHVDNVDELKEKLIADKLFTTELLFRSPGGKGLKWVIAIDLNVCNHLSWFNAVAAYLQNTHNLTADKSGKDISRACYLPYDPDAYINPRYLSADNQ